MTDPAPLTVFEPAVINFLELHLEQTYEAIHKKAPNAVIIIAGYPLLFPHIPTSSCNIGYGYSFSTARQSLLNTMGLQLDTMIASAVAAVKDQGVDIHYVDPTSAFAGHSVCESSSTRWIRRLKAFYLSPAGFKRVNPGSFHPNQSRQNAYATLFNDCLARIQSC